MTVDINDATNIVPGSQQTKLSSTSLTTILNNAASSGTLIMVTSIVICNEDTANTTYITITRHSQDDVGGTAYNIMNQVDIAPGYPLQLLEHPIFLDEDKSLGATAEAANDMVVTVDYLVFS